MLLAGSHAGATAYSLVQEIKRRKLPWKIFWVGKKWATEKKKSYTLEYNVLPRLGVTFYPVESGRIQTKLTRHTLTAILKIPLGLLASGYYVAKIRPGLILTFGGAAGAEVSFWGWVFGIPIVVHEQTVVAGRANLFASKFAKLVALSRASSRPFFRGENTILTGNPINPAIANKTGKNQAKEAKTIFITGGSRGSEWINNAAMPILPGLLKKYNVILQAGEGNTAKFRIPDSKLQLYGQIEPKIWPKILSSADIVVTRAGANIVSELMALKKPCILIPIPWTYMDEQTKNAELARNFGIARILPQADLAPQRLKLEIENLVRDYSEIIRKVRNKVSPDLDASQKVVNILEKYI